MGPLINAAIAIAVALAFGAWVFGLTGYVEIRTGEYWIGLSLAAAVGLGAVGFVLFHLVLRLYGWFVTAPERRKLRVALDERAMAELAMTRALVALAAGEAGKAREEAARARRFAGDTPLALHLEAEAARAAGDEAAATRAYEALAAQPESRFLGLDGLRRLAEAKGDAEAAARLSHEAVAAEEAGDDRLAPPATDRAALARAWEAGPAPEIGARYLDGEEDAAARLRLVDELTRSSVTHWESRVLRTEAALAAGNLIRARLELSGWEATGGTVDPRWHDLQARLAQAEAG
jgi:HemY protein